MQFPGSINSSGGEFITVITAEELSGGKLSEGRLCGESLLIGRCDLQLRKPSALDDLAERALGRNKHLKHPSHIRLLGLPITQTPQDSANIINIDQLLKHSSVKMQGNGLNGVKEDNPSQRGR